MGLNWSVSGTVLKAELAVPLLPGEQTTFNMAWNSQVPKQIRRSGYGNKEGVEFTMTQWYPKLAEYDKNGWHPDQYVGREFYGIWGDFDVTIHAHRDYVLGGTGYLQNADATGFGYEGFERVRVKKNKKRVWRFKADRVHDFAFAADPDFVHDQLQIENGPLVHLFYDPATANVKNWKRLQEGYLQGYFDFMSTNFGKYPYRQFSIIQGGDGGMEYPMITLITGNRSLPSLVGVTVHEMSHSWFQAVVATNEALYEWMDEGFTSWIETECMEVIAPREMSKNKVGGAHTYSYSGYINQALSGNEEALSTHADHYTTNRAYGIAAYAKGEVLVEQLGAIIGEETRNRGMKKYFKDWSFKHPGPTDFKRVMERTSGIELDWYFDYFVNTTHTIDYSIKSVATEKNESTITLEKIGVMPMPQDLMVTFKDGSSTLYHIPLVIMRGNRTMNDGERLATDWPWTNPTYSIDIPTLGKRIASITLDPLLLQADVNRENNTVEFKSIGKQNFNR